MSVDRGMDKEVVCLCDGILLSPEKERNRVVCRAVDGPVRLLLKTCLLSHTLFSSPCFLATLYLPLSSGSLPQGPAVSYTTD